MVTVEHVTRTFGRVVFARELSAYFDSAIACIFAVLLAPLVLSAYGMARHWRSRRGFAAAAPRVSQGERQ